MEEIINLIKSVNVEYLIKYAEIIVIILGFQIIGPIVARIIIGIVHKLMKSDKKSVESGFYKPLKYFFYVLGFYISIYTLGTTKGIEKLADKAMRIVVIVLFAKGIADSLNPDSPIFNIINKNSKKESNNNDALNLFLSKVLKTLVYIIMAFVVITEFGYDLSGLAAGLGIASAAVALAAQDIVKSLIGGFTIITDKPFDIGDYIEIGGGLYTGTVVDITFRSTRIKVINNSIITIPNSLLVSEYIINWNKLESRMIETYLRISLESTTEQINRCISKIITVLNTNDIVLEDTTEVHLDKIGEDCNSIFIRTYISVTDYSEYLKAKDKILCDILDVLERENIDLVYPTQTVYTKNRV